MVRIASANSSLSRLSAAGAKGGELLVHEVDKAAGQRDIVSPSDGARPYRVEQLDVWLKSRGPADKAGVIWCLDEEVVSSRMVPERSRRHGPTGYRPGLWETPRGGHDGSCGT
jgi:hypothetical protein